MSEIEELIDQYEPEDPLLKAGRKLTDLHEYTVKFANAVEEHPDIPYETVESGVIRTDLLDDNSNLSPGEAVSDIELYSILLSDAWQDTQEYFMFDFREEFYGYLELTDEDAKKDKQAFRRQQQLYDQIEQELQRIEDSLQDTEFTIADSSRQTRTLRPAQDLSSLNSIQRMRTEKTVRFST